MKPYFTKYLPVEGEIKVGDEIVITRHGKTIKKPVTRLKYPNGDKTLPFAIAEIKCTKLEAFRFKKEDYPVRYFGGDHYADDVIEIEVKREELGLAKLFLCSRDIQVGDRVWNQDSGYGEVKEIDIENEYLGVKYDLQDYEVEEDFKYIIKVIGEISSNAKWVTEGMEFDRDQLKIWKSCDSYSSKIITEAMGKKWEHKEDSIRTPGKVIKIEIKCPCCDKYS